MSNKRFTRKVASIMGAASGIGKATANLLAKEGASIWCADINGQGMEDTISEIKQSGGDAAEANEVAHMIAYVASDEARFVNGAILSIDGGTSCG